MRTEKQARPRRMVAASFWGKLPRQIGVASHDIIVALSPCGYIDWSSTDNKILGKVS